MKNWKLINKTFVGEEDNVSGIPMKGDIIKIGEDFSYYYKTPFLQESNDIPKILSSENPYFEDRNSIFGPINLNPLEVFETLNSVDSFEQINDFDRLVIMYNKAEENGRHK